MRNILVAVDFSPISEKLLDEVTAIARAQGGRLWLVHVAAPDPDFAKESEGSLRKVETELKRCGLGLKNIVSATVYLTDIRMYAAFNEVYARVLPAPYPARACVAVKELPGSARVEVQVVAARPGPR